MSESMNSRASLLSSKPNVCAFGCVGFLAFLLLQEGGGWLPWEHLAAAGTCVLEAAR